MSVGSKNSDTEAGCGEFHAGSCGGAACPRCVSVSHGGCPTLGSCVICVTDGNTAGPTLNQPLGHQAVGCLWMRCKTRVHAFSRTI